MAERAIYSIHQTPQRSGPGIEPKILYIGQHGVRRRRVVEQRLRPVQLHVSLFWVQRLPDEPSTVQHRVAQPECGVYGRGEEVLRRENSVSWGS